MKDIKELTLNELEEKLSSLGEPEYRAKQIFNWIYKQGVYEFSQMSDLSAGLRDRLCAEFYVLGLELAQIKRSCDGTGKFLFKLKDGNLVEAVNIPAAKRSTACLSSQVGCKFSCSFCASGLKGFKRNLSAGEMLDEALYLKNNAPAAELTHVVFMGTGEPLDNYDNLLKAIRVLNSPQAFNIGARRITISTCGIIPALKKLQEEDLQVELSVSLHAADEERRSRIMPVNKKYPLKQLIPAIKEYINKTKRQVTFEYVLIKGFNADRGTAGKLACLLKDLRLAKVNLIPANPVRRLRVFPPPPQETEAFRKHLLNAGVNVTLRKERGQDIDAACGQLRLKYEES